MYASIDSKFLEKNKEKALKDYKEETGEEDERYLFTNLDDRVESVIEETGKITIMVSNSLGYFSIEYNLDSEDLIRLFEVAVKKMNKVKTLLESLK